jgi:hypothetical protein
VVAGAGDIAATGLSEGAATGVLADWLSPWSAEAPATGFTDGIAPVTTTGDAASAGLSDETAAAAAGGRSTDAGGLRSSEFKAFELHLTCVLKALLTLRRVVGGSRAVRFRDAYQLEAGVQSDDGLACGLRENDGARKAERGRDPWRSHREFSLCLTGLARSIQF